MIRPCKNHMTGDIVYELWMDGHRVGLTHKTRADAYKAELRYMRAYKAGDCMTNEFWAELLAIK